MIVLLVKLLIFISMSAIKLMEAIVLEECPTSSPAAPNL